MTPYLSRLAVGALSEESITRIWTLAAMMRMKKLPKLEKLTGKGKSKGKDMLSLKTALMGASTKKRG